MKLLRKIGKYVEVCLLIDATENEDSSNNCPITKVDLHNCNIKDIARMYTTLKATLQMFIEKYPSACLFGELTMSSTVMNSQEIKSDRQEE